MLLKLFASMYTKWMHLVERKIGYSLKFDYIPRGYINGWMTFSMWRSWRKQGIRAKGVNYFTVGSLKNGLSARFLRNEKQYQSWLGAYLVKFEDNKKLNLQNYYNLTVADQRNWLGDFGDSDPYIEMLQKNTGKVKDIRIGKYNGKLFEFLGGPSHSDVGSKCDNKYNMIIMALMASMFNKCNSKLSLKSKNFIPRDLSFKYNYETVNLKGYIAVIDLEKNIKVVLYGNGAEILNEKGQKVDYSPSLKRDILKFFRSVKITKFEK